MTVSRYPDWIMERALGGSTTAESPSSISSHHSWPDGREAPVARSACTVLADVAREKPSNLGGPAPCWVFLVGGAGNGKSKLARATLDELGVEPLDQGEAFARRVYRYSLGLRRGLTVVNDATIPPGDEEEFPLVADLERTIDQREDLLACVNRGVLLAEARVAPSADSSSNLQGASDVVRWLLNQDSTRHDGSLHLEEVDLEKEHRGAYRFASLLDGDTPVAHLHAVFMDQASLLEPWAPRSDVGKTSDQPLGTESWQVLPILDRQLEGDEDVPFARSLAQLGNALGGELQPDELDPVLANARSIADAAPAWCSLVRGTEIMRGAQFTYRELWALSVMSLVGPSDSLSALADHVQANSARARAQDGVDRLLALISLAQVRSHVLMFEAGRERSRPLPRGANNPRWPGTGSEAVQALRAADPLRDFGERDGKAYVDLVGRLAAIEDGGLPLRDLASVEPAITRYIAPLDLQLEQHLMEFLRDGQGDVSLEQRNEFLSWYGEYCTRLVGLARGRPAFSTACNRWQVAYLNAHKHGRLREQLKRSIMDILMPGSRDSHVARFPVLGDRVDDTIPSRGAVMVELDASRFNLMAETRGSSVVLSLVSGPAEEKAAEAILDFHLVREALSRSEGSGFTDSLPLVEPRIERTRARLVAYAISHEDPPPRYGFACPGGDVFTTI